ncbi:MAG: DEAD/DEAH box helicase [Gammaproteobacteria bacterium]|nr:DEAD/DEAH box helicase [Gammaproteobacteria bacterium]MBQ0839339.1 DEAD/DEAH box helicase [Gammaproteobacteria bacterium]
MSASDAKPDANSPASQDASPASGDTKPEEVTFSSLNLSAAVLKAVEELGYEQPSAIQAQAIPLLLGGGNLLGTAQTGTGKTAAFALPLLSKLKTSQRKPQILVLAPTRELAIQVAEAFQTYARYMKGFHVLPVYGGQDIRGQLRALSRGADVVVGTPGRLIDHINRRTLDLSELKAVVLDEADEMLRMGFIDDIETILSKTPKDAQRALFSATMPAPIRRVANTYLGDAQVVRITNKTSTVEKIDQKYLIVNSHQKLDALTRILEVEDFGGIIIFVRTKSSTVDLAEKLQARGYAASALNGDLNQALREQTINKLKKGVLDIIVATDVAARGLDVERISHVINYDIPNDNESYVHRIGRTGRAGREGKAILFVAPKERRMLRSIEKTTRQPLAAMDIPSGEEISGQRIQRFQDKVLETLQKQDLSTFRDLLEKIAHENELDMGNIAAALAWQAQQKTPLYPSIKAITAPTEKHKGRLKNTEKNKRPQRDADSDSRDTPRRDKAPRKPSPKGSSDKAISQLRQHPDVELVRYRIDVGNNHGASPGDIVGAMINEAGIESEFIGHIDMQDEHSTVDLPEGMPKEIFQHLKRVRVRQQAMNIEQVSNIGDQNRDKLVLKRTNKKRPKIDGAGKKRGDKKPRAPKPEDFS